MLCCFDKLISEYKCDIIEALSSKTLCEDSSSRKIDSPCNIVRLLSREYLFIQIKWQGENGISSDEICTIHYRDDNQMGSFVTEEN